MIPKVVGLWPLVGSEPVLWTAKAADIIRSKETGKEYIKGKMKLFTSPGIPTKIEDDPDKWEFIYLRNGKQIVDTDTYVRDIWVNQILKK